MVNKGSPGLGILLAGDFLYLHPSLLKLKSPNFLAFSPQVLATQTSAATKGLLPHLFIFNFIKKSIHITYHFIYCLLLSTSNGPIVFQRGQMWYMRRIIHVRSTVAFKLHICLEAPQSPLLQDPLTPALIFLSILYFCLPQIIKLPSISASLYNFGPRGQSCIFNPTPSKHPGQCLRLSQSSLLPL